MTDTDKRVEVNKLGRIRAYVADGFYLEPTDSGFLLSEIDRLKKENETQLNNALKLLTAGCEKHIDEIKQMSFSEYTEKYRNVCAMCFQEEIDRLKKENELTGKMNAALTVKWLKFIAENEALRKIAEAAHKWRNRKQDANCACEGPKMRGTSLDGSECQYCKHIRTELMATIDSCYVRT